MYKRYITIYPVSFDPFTNGYWDIIIRGVAYLCDELIIRMPTDKIRVISRRSKGVRLFNINNDQKVVSASRVSDNSSDDDEDEALDNSDDTEEQSTKE